MTTAFDADLGTYQGQIQKDGAPEGTHVYELGHALPGVVRSFKKNDEHTLSQTGSLAGVTVVRATVDIRPPADVPLGMTWTFRAEVAGADGYTLDIWPGRTRRRVDIGINVTDVASGPDVAIKFALEVGGAGDIIYSAEMPSVQVDSVILDSSAVSPALVCRDPEPGDVDVPLDQTIGFRITDPAGGGSAPTLTNVWVNGELVVDAGVAQGSWALANTSVGPHTVSYVLTPPDPFGSEELVTVRVTAASTSGTLDRTWSFTAVDLLAPELVSVLGFTRRQVRVEFDEPVELGDGTGQRDALNPVNYTLSLVSGAPAIVPAVSSVEALSGEVVLLHLAEEMTPGAHYRLTVPNIADVDANVVADPGLVGDFIGYRSPAPTGRNADLVTFYQLVPEILRSMDRVGTGHLKLFLDCLQEPTDQILADIDEWPTILDPDLAPEPFIDAMLVDFGNPFEEFSTEFTLAGKRKLLSALVPISKQKGTDIGMVNAIRLLLGLEVTILVPAADSVWSLGDSELGVDTYQGTDDVAVLYGFYVVSPIELTDEQRTNIRKIVAYMRRAETHLLGIKEPPAAPAEPDGWELGLAHLGAESYMH